MASERIHPHKKFWVMVAIVLAFVAGFLVARVRYKPQIQTTYNMVVEREAIIQELRSTIEQLTNPIMEKK